MHLINGQIRQPGLSMLSQEENSLVESGHFVITRDGEESVNFTPNSNLARFYNFSDGVMGIPSYQLSKADNTGLLRGHFYSPLLNAF